MTVKESIIFYFILFKIATTVPSFFEAATYV